MSVIKNRSTQKGREFWDHIDAVVGRKNSAMSEWISVLDKLPPDREYVIVFAGYWSAYPFIGHLNHGLWIGERILGEPSAVTHWMPLPEPPSGERGKG